MCAASSDARMRSTATGVLPCAADAFAGVCACAITAVPAITIEATAPPIPDTTPKDIHRMIAP
jgi:hypothetical protein